MEKIYLHKRKTVKIVTFTVSALAVVLSFFVSNVVKTANYRKEIENGYARAANCLAESVSAMEIELKKCICSGSEKSFDKTAAKLWVYSQQAKIYAGELPLGIAAAANIERFLEQTGNYAVSAAGGKLDEEQYDELIDLSSYAGEFRVSLEEFITAASAGGSWEEECERIRMDDDIKAGKIRAGEQAVDIFEEYPSLIYDGPFSDHIFEKEPELLKTRHEITQEQAAQIAKAALSDKVSVFVGESNGKIKEYIFTGADGASEIAVTKQGGLVSYILNHRPQGEIRLSIEEAENRARNFLDGIGYGDFVKLQHNVYECSYVASFAPRQDNIILYPDQIKVEVSMDCGDIAAFDARDYIMNHCDRRMLSASKTRLQAEKCVSDMLTVKDCRLVLIQSETLKELLCYEFLCERWDGGEALVYINANDLSEEKVFLITRTDDGVLTI